MSETFSAIIAQCELENPSLIKELCAPMRAAQEAGIRNATGLVDALVRDGMRTAEEGNALKEAINCVAQNEPGNLKAGIEPDYYSPVLHPVNVSEATRKTCKLKSR